MSSRKGGKRGREATEGGLRMFGRILTIGPIPPAYGIGRVQWCLAEGLAQLHAGTGSLSTAYRSLMEILPGGLLRLPDYYPSHMVTTEDYSLHVGQERWVAWRMTSAAFRSRGGLANDAVLLPCLDYMCKTPAMEIAELGARSAEGDLATAYHFLHEAAIEAATITDDAVIEVVAAQPAATLNATEARQVLTDLADRAHALTHQAAELVSGLFGCRVDYEDGAWMSGCGLVSMHLSLGLSAGFTARHVCSICALHTAACDHTIGVTYDVIAGRQQADIGSNFDTEPEGRCNICDLTICEHAPGTQYPVVASTVIRNPVLREVSLTPRPRDPRARIERHEVSGAELLEQLGGVPHHRDVIERRSCVAPCVGFSDPALMLEGASQ